MKSTIMKGTRRRKWREINGQEGTPISDVLDTLWSLPEVHELVFYFLEEILSLKCPNHVRLLE